MEEVIEREGIRYRVKLSDYDPILKEIVKDGFLLLTVTRSCWSDRVFVLKDQVEDRKMINLLTNRLIENLNRYRYDT